MRRVLKDELEAGAQISSSNAPENMMNADKNGQFPFGTPSSWAKCRGSMLVFLIRAWLMIFERLFRKLTGADGDAAQADQRGRVMICWGG